MKQPLQNFWEEFEVTISSLCEGSRIIERIKFVGVEHYPTLSCTSAYLLPPLLRIPRPLSPASRLDNGLRPYLLTKHLCNWSSYPRLICEWPAKRLVLFRIHLTNNYPWLHVLKMMAHLASEEDPMEMRFSSMTGIILIMFLAMAAEHM